MLRVVFSNTSHATFRFKEVDFLRNKIADISGADVNDVVFVEESNVTYSLGTNTEDREVLPPQVRVEWQTGRTAGQKSDIAGWIAHVLSVHNLDLPDITFIDCEPGSFFSKGIIKGKQKSSRSHSFGAMIC